MPASARDLDVLRTFIRTSRESGGAIYEDNFGKLASDSFEPAIVRVQFGRLERAGYLVRRQDTVRVRNPAYKPPSLAERMSTISTLLAGREPEYLEQKGRSYWELTEAGAEAFAPEEILSEEGQGSVPASDRVVRLDDNSRERQDAVHALERVEDEIAVGRNDLPMTHEEAEVARTEVATLRQRLQTGWVRLGELVTAVGENGTLRWLMSKLGDDTRTALVGIAIAALLALIGIL